MNHFLKKIIPPFGIQGKLTLIFILLSTLPIILVSIFTVNQQIDYKREENIREMESDIKGLKERTTLFLTRIESEILLVMKSTELKKMLTILENKKEVEDQLQQNVEKEFLNIISGNNFYLKVTLLNKSGKEVLSVTNDGKRAAIIPREQLSRTPKNYYVHTVSEMSPGEIYLSPSEVRNPNNNVFVPVIDFVLPVYNQNKEVSAIVAANIRVENLFELLVPLYNVSSKKIFIVNGEGYYIFHSMRKNNWNMLFANRSDENIFRDYSNEIAEKILKEKASATLYYQDRIIQYSPIFSGSKAVTDKYFIVEDVAAEVVLSSIDKLKLLLIVLVLIIAIVSLLVGYLTTRQFLKPIKQLIRGTQIIRSGNLDYKLEITTRDEIQDLISNFNQLVLEWKNKQLLEKEVRKSEKLIASVTQTATDAILEVDSSGKIIVWNDAASRIFGFSKDEALGKNVFSLIVPEKDRRIAKEKLAAFLKDGADVSLGTTIEVNALRKEGGEFPAELSISSVLLDEALYATGIIRDITQRKKMVNDLIEAKEKAEVADRLKSEFLNQMSHEIRTPLNSLLNFSDYIREDLQEKDQLTDDINENFHEVQESGARIIRTVELILLMSQIQTGSYENKPEQTNIYSDILMALSKKYLPLADDKNLQFDLINKSETPFSNVDPYSVTQVFSHLIDNAIKFTNKGSVTITIKNNEMKRLVAAVEDTGIGISEEYLPELFNPFSQEQHGLTRAYDGNGLGLALVKKLCEMNDIFIEVTTVKGEGTCFNLIFPQ
ncbi:hypothetical protein C0389_07140 [bacterium]|nr:hypothetical protein [bacterium]